MRLEYREAFEEIYEIFNLMPKELLNKIPTKFYEIIKTERDTNYSPNIQEPLEEHKLKNETIIILGLIYRDFLCSPEEKRILKEKDAKELQEIEKELKEQIREEYNPDAIFKKKKGQRGDENEQIQEHRLTIIKEEKWYKKIFNIIKGLFKKY